MRILFIIEGSSIHAARWIGQFADMGWDVHAVQACPPDYGVCPELRCGTFHVHYPVPAPAGLACRYTLRKGIAGRVVAKMGLATGQPMERAHAEYIARLIRDLKPDVIHSLGLGVQWRNLARPALAARTILGDRFPAPWIYSSWGTDLECFAALPEQREEVRRFLGAIDYHVTECERDARLARSLGFRGECLGVFPAFGGTDLTAMSGHRAAGAASGRRTVVLKGRDHARGGDPIGRALTALEAFRECRGELRGYRIAILQANPAVAEAAERLKGEGLDVVVMPRLEYVDVMKLVGSARVFMSLTVNDGLPSSLVEAMALGVLPLHSDLEPIREWIVHGENGLLVQPEDVGATAAALKRALTDDGLVDSADGKNREIVRMRLEYQVIRQRAMEMYEQVAR